MLKRKLEVFGKRLFVTGIVLGLFFAGCAGDPEVTSDAGAVEKEEVVDSKEGDVLQEQEVQAEDERQEEAAGNSFDSQEPDVSHETSDQSEGDEDIIAAVQDLRDNSFTAEQLQEIYGSIKDSVKSRYLDQNGIDPKDFEWPQSSDNAWLYFDHIGAMYMSTGQYSIEGFDDDMLSDQDQQLMNSVLEGMIAWDQSSGNNDFSSVKLALLPSSEKIPANVNFSD